VSVNPAAWLDYTRAGGIVNPFTNNIYIRKSYYTNPCLSDSQKDDLRQLLAHEALHIFLNRQIGFLEYLEYNNQVGYHDWIYSTAAGITSYEDGLAAPGAPPPSIYTYPDVPFNPND
jgi:hypothetical protein